MPIMPIQHGWYQPRWFARIVGLFSLFGWAFYLCPFGHVKNAMCLLKNAYLMVWYQPVC